MHVTRIPTALTLLLLLASAAAGQQPSSGAQWLAAIDEAEEVEHSYAVMQQIITTSTGAERTLTMRSWSDRGGQVQLMAYTDPARVRGDKILQINDGDDIYYYMKRRDVTRHFAGHSKRQSAMGSDFTYEDLSMGDLTEDYTAEVLGRETRDGVEVVKLKLVPEEDAEITYDHLVLTAGVEDKLTRRIEYYDDEGHLKTLTISDFQRVDGRKVGMHMRMENHRENSHTVIRTREMDLDVQPDPALFTKRALPETIR